MTREIRIEIPGQPVPKARARIYRDKRSGKPRGVTPAKTKDYEQTVAWCAAGVMAGQRKLKGPLVVDITFWMQTPISWSNKRRQEAFRGEIMPTTKPDIDNMTKAILDALNKIVYKDDAQVCIKHARKFYAEHPRATVHIREIPRRGTP